MVINDFFGECDKTKTVFIYNMVIYNKSEQPEEVRRGYMHTACYGIRPADETLEAKKSRIP